VEDLVHLARRRRSGLCPSAGGPVPPLPMCPAE
jgi:hypothetical protein